MADIGLILTLIGAFCVVLGTVGTAWWRVTTLIANESAKWSKQADLLHKRNSALKDEFNDYKLQVAEKYASITLLKEVEERLVTAVERLTDKISSVDRLVDEIHALRDCWSEPRVTRKPSDK